MPCQERAGFLMLRPCSNAASYQCALCNKEICQQHAVPAQLDDQGLIVAAGTAGSHAAMVCGGCVRQRRAQAGGANNLWYDNYYYGYSPFYFGIYSDEDRRAFDRGEPATAGDAADVLGS